MTAMRRWARTLHRGDEVLMIAHLMAERLPD